MPDMTQKSAIEDLTSRRRLRDRAVDLAMIFGGALLVADDSACGPVLIVTGLVMLTAALHPVSMRPPDAVARAGSGRYAAGWGMTGLAFLAAAALLLIQSSRGPVAIAIGSAVSAAFGYALLRVAYEFAKHWHQPDP
jgi:hypothetical protein